MSLIKEPIQINSAMVRESIMYSNYVEDLDTVGCLFANQEMMFESRKVYKPHVDLLVSLQPAQS